METNKTLSYQSYPLCVLVLHTKCTTDCATVQMSESHMLLLQPAFRAVEARGPGGTPPLPILDDQLTLYQTGGRLCQPHFFLPRGFSDTPRALISSSNSASLYSAGCNKSQIDDTINKYPHPAEQQHHRKNGIFHEKNRNFTKILWLPKQTGRQLQFKISRK